MQQAVVLDQSADEYKPKIDCLCESTYLIVNQSPLLQEAMDAHDGTDIASQIPSTRSDSKVLGGAQAIRVDHKVTVILVYSRGLAAIPRVEELGERFLFYGVDFGHVEPGRVGGDDDVVGLRGEVLARLLLEAQTRGLVLRGVLLVVVVA